MFMLKIRLRNEKITFNKNKNSNIPIEPAKCLKIKTKFLLKAIKGINNIFKLVSFLS